MFPHILDQLVNKLYAIGGVPFIMLGISMVVVLIGAFIVSLYFYGPVQLASSLARFTSTLVVKAALLECSLVMLKLIDGFSWPFSAGCLIAAFSTSLNLKRSTRLPSIEHSLRGLAREEQAQKRMNTAISQLPSWLKNFTGFTTNSTGFKSSQFPSNHLGSFHEHASTAVGMTDWSIKHNPPHN